MPRGCGVCDVRCGVVRMTLKLVRPSGCVRPRRSLRVPRAAVSIPLLCGLGMTSLLGLLFLTEPPQHRPPLPAGYSRLYPRNATLAGLSDFSYVINSDACASDNVTSVIVVTSHEGNQAVRNAWRRLLNDSDLAHFGARRVFLLGRPSKQADYVSVDERQIEDEAAMHGDIVQGSFLEDYRNLTFKHLMGLQWAQHYCPQAAYVIKMDDDIVVDFYQLFDKLYTRYRPQNLLLGLIHYDMKPMRNRSSKWFVPYTEYSGEFYRPFLSGWTYVASQDVVSRLVAASYRRRLFWIDDVHVTGTLAGDVGIRQSSLNSYYTPHVDHLECCIRDVSRWCDYMVGPAGGDETLMRDFLSHARRCWLERCERRPSEQAIARTCVGTDRYRHASPVRGVAEVVSVSWG